MKRSTALLFLLMSTVLLSACAGSRAAPRAPQEHVVEMKLDGDDMVFEPDKVNARLGDKVIFVMVSGPPHTVTFEPDKVPGSSAGEREQLAERLTYQDNEGFFEEPGEKYTIHLVDLPTGEYGYYCLPHEAMGMTGTIRIR